MNMTDIFDGIKKLGFGMMRLPMLQDGSVDIESVSKMFDYFIGHGFSYFDTAYVYADGKLEEAVRETLVKRYPRENWQLATKLPIWLVSETRDMEKMFETQLERTGAGYFDFYLLHAQDAQSNERCKKLGAWEFMKQKKEAGLIRHIGFSFHDKAEVLDKILIEHPEAEFVQLQINYIDWEDGAVESRLCYETALKHGKPVVVMEPIKGGSLLRVKPEILEIFRQANHLSKPASWALRFVSSLPGVKLILSGMNDMSQVIENCETLESFKPLDDRERETISRVVAEIKKIPEIPCTRCNYCVETCPRKVPIPQGIGALNLYRIYNNYDEAAHIYGGGLRDGSSASDCIECGACQERCPQHLPIIEIMKEVVSAFGK
jgi:predicted aldo/keto reductase-like oxidoreductase